MLLRFAVFWTASATTLAAQVGTDPAFSELLVREQLKSDAALAVLGIVFVALGLLCGLLSLMRRQAKDWSLLTLGALSALYGLRILFLETPTVAFLFELSPALVDHARAAVGYVITIPALLFARQMLGDGWKSSLRWLVRAQSVFAPVAIMSDVLQREPYSVESIQRGLLVAGMATVGGAFLWSNRLPLAGSRAVVAGLSVFAAAALFRNLPGGEGLGRYLEPTALLLLVLSLGYSAALRILGRENRLLAIEQELATARQIQNSILPKDMPQTNRVNVAVRYSPMTEVAGDFYDFVELDSSRLAVLVADVSGHGVPAALVASMVKVGFGLEQTHASDPSKVLTDLNRVLHGQTDSQFVTAGCLYIDTASDKMLMRYAGAAHPPLLRCNRESGVFGRFEENGLMLGPFAQTEFGNVEADIEAGDRFVLVTDGILEAADSTGEFFGEERLKQFTESHAQVSADVFADELLRELGRFTGSDVGANQGDDITLVVVDILGP